MAALSFVRKFAARMNKSIEAVPAEVMDVLKLHDWPGNVRELQNFVERAVIMSAGGELRPPLEELEQLTTSKSPSAVRTLAEAERSHILQALRAARWVVGGPGGAASRLGLPRTTLIYRMRKLGIMRGEVTTIS